MFIHDKSIQAYTDYFNNILIKSTNIIIFNKTYTYNINKSTLSINILMI